MKWQFMMPNYEIDEFVGANEMFGSQIYNFLLKASAQTLTANKENKIKSGLHFFLIPKMKGFEF